MLVVALVVLAVTIGILIACLAIAERTIRGLRETIRVQAVTERRLAANVRRLQEDLVHHAVEAQVVTWWRSRHEVKLS